MTAPIANESLPIEFRYLFAEPAHLTLDNACSMIAAARAQMKHPIIISSEGKAGNIKNLGYSIRQYTGARELRMAKQKLMELDDIDHFFDWRQTFFFRFSTLRAFL